MWLIINEQQNKWTSKLEEIQQVLHPNAIEESKMGVIGLWQKWLFNQEWNFTSFVRNAEMQANTEPTVVWENSGAICVAVYTF